MSEFEIAQKQIQETINELQNTAELVMLGYGSYGIVYLYDERLIYKFASLNEKYQLLYQTIKNSFKNEINHYNNFKQSKDRRIAPDIIQSSELFVYFSQNYMNLGTLKQNGIQNVLSKSTIYQIAIQLLKILDILHNQYRIYHLDIKPDNILFNEQFVLRKHETANQNQQIQVQLLNQFFQRFMKNDLQVNLMNASHNSQIQQRILSKMFEQQQKNKIKKINYQAGLSDDDIIQLALLIQEICQYEQPNQLDDIIIVQEVNVVLIDFGLSSRDGLPKNNSQYITQIGTQPYMSPFMNTFKEYNNNWSQDFEQMIGKQCDLFSFGMTIFLLLARSLNINIPDPDEQYLQCDPAKESDQLIQNMIYKNPYNIANNFGIDTSQKIKWMYFKQKILNFIESSNELHFLQSILNFNIIPEDINIHYKLQQELIILIYSQQNQLNFSEEIKIKFQEVKNFQKQQNKIYKNQ